MYNSLVLQRLVRYYASVMRGEKLAPNPGDDLNVPPMALSYRETLKLGKSLDLELLNIPDGSSGTDRAELELCGLQGKPLLRFPSEKFDRSVLRAITFRVPSEKLSRQVVLTPRLTVTGADENKLVYENLQYVRLLPTFCYIYKSVRQSLRDLFTPANWEFDSKMNADGTVQLAGFLKAGEKLASLEVTDFGREVFRTDSMDKMRKTWGSLRLPEYSDLSIIGFFCIFLLQRFAYLSVRSLKSVKPVNMAPRSTHVRAARLGCPNTPYNTNFPFFLKVVLIFDFSGYILYLQ